MIVAQGQEGAVAATVGTLGLLYAAHKAIEAAGASINRESTATLFATHNRYADGNHRPLYRGWLHGLMAAFTVLMTALYIDTMERVVMPTVLAVCWQLLFSSLLHLVPWGSVRAEDVVCRLDRLGVVLITVAGFYSTQMLPCAATCSPPHAEFAVPFVLLPNCVSAAMILAGVKMGTRPSPYSFAGVGLSCVTMAAYWSSSSDWDLLGFEAAVVALDAIGLYIYATQAGGAATWWGFHEWMHLSVGIGFYLNIYLVSLIADPDRCLR